jgi:hypothetical protein
MSNYLTIRSSQCVAVIKNCCFLYGGINVLCGHLVSPQQKDQVATINPQVVGIRFARLSILFSIIRLHTIPGQRNRFLFVAAGFALAGVLLLAQLFWVCVPDATWRKLPIPQCPLDTQIVACQLICQ